MMGRNRAVSGLRWLAVWLAWLLAGETPAEEVDAVCDRLDAAVTQWREGLEFACHYTQRMRLALTKDEALADQRNPGLSMPNYSEECRGVFCKMGENMRLLVDYGKPPIVDPRPNGASMASMSIDTVVVKGLLLEYYLPYGGYGGSVRVDRAIPSRLESWPHQGAGPFSFGGGVEGTPLKSYAAQRDPREVVRKSVVRPTPAI